MEGFVPIAEYEALKEEKSALEHQLAQLTRLLYGSRRERHEPSAEAPGQLAIPFGGSTGEAAQPGAAQPEKEKITYERTKAGKKPHPGRNALPAHLPVEEVVILAPEEQAKDLVEIGEVITETLDYRPAVLYKRVYIRKKYAYKKAGEGRAEVLTTSLPSRPLPKAIAEAGLLAHLMVSKFIDHLPFYRQAQQMRRNHDWAVSQATLNGWFAEACKLLGPLYEAHTRQVMATSYLQADESPIKVLDREKKGKTHQGYMWVYRNPSNGLVFFDYRKGRGTHGLEDRLKGFSGHLQCDGYTAYAKMARQRLESGPSLILVSCMAHIRRKFYDAKKHHPEWAGQALLYIQALYRLERIYREEGLTKEKKAIERQTEARPIFDAFQQWVEENWEKIPPKGPIAKAMKYAREQLPKLRCYLTDGRIEIDNNLIENAIRPLALGRKNFLFAGSHEGARRAAMMYSFFATCKTTGINPWEWLTDVLQRIPDTPINQIDTLLPNNWEKKENDKM